MTDAADGAPAPHALFRDADRAVRRFFKGVDFLARRDEVRVDVTPRVLVRETGTRRLWRYAPARRAFRTPVLLVHSLISRPTVFDLAPGMSLIGHLTGEGHEVYLLDWGAPRGIDRHLRLEDYAVRFLGQAIEDVRRSAGSADVTLFGYCFGGTMALIHAALHPEASVRAVATAAAPLDFAHLDLFTAWSGRSVVDADALVDVCGNLPAAMVHAVFRSLKPASDIGTWFGLYGRLLDDDYVETFKAIDRWTSDHVPIAGETARQVIRDLFQANALAAGTLHLDGRRVDLSRVTVPFASCRGTRDHIVPEAAVGPVLDRVGSADRREIAVDAGHMGILAGRDAARKFWPRLDAWLREHCA